MKSKVLLLGLSVITALAVGNNTLKQTKAEDFYDLCPAQGEVDGASFFGPAWTSKLGARRVADRTVAVTDVVGWGYRGNFVNRTYDATSFTATFDLKQIPGKTAFSLVFGSAAGSYSTESTFQLCLDICSDSKDPTKFIVTCSNTKGAHNISIPEFTDGGTWADDANYKGVAVTTTDSVVTLKLQKLNETSTNVIVNDITTVVPTSEVYKNFEDPTKSYVCFGGFNNSGTETKYLISDVGDASDVQYFAADGVFYTVKKQLTELKDASLNTVEEVLAAKEKFDAVQYSSLYGHDRNYFGSLYQEVKTKIDDAVEKAGNEVAVSLYKNSVAELKTRAAKLTNSNEVIYAIAQLKDADAKHNGIDVEALSGTVLDDYNAALNDYTAAKEAIMSAVPVVYDNAIKDYEESVKTIASTDDILVAQSYRSKIPNALDEYLSETVCEEYANRIHAATSTLDSKTVLNHDNWKQGKRAKTIINSDGSIGLVSYGGTNYGNTDDTSGVFCQEALSSTNFSTKFKIDKFTNAGAGAWITFGLMEKPDMWINAETDAVQENKGIFFLLTKVNSTTISVQAFLCSLLSNRFYDSPLQQTINVDMTGDIEVKFEEVEKEIAGLSDTYFEMSFNGIKFDQETITAKKIKTVLGKDKLGYFMMASSSAPITDPNVITIKEINGVSPTAATLSKAVSTEPKSTDTEKNWTTGTSSNVSFALDTQGQDITSVTCDGTPIDAANYTYADSRFTLKNAYLATLSVGDHTIEVNTASGKVTWTLHVKQNSSTPSSTSAPSSDTPTSTTPSDDNPTPSKKGGCGGSIVAATSLLGMVTLLGAALVAKKNKED